MRTACVSHCRSILAVPLSSVDKLAISTDILPQKVKTHLENDVHSSKLSVRRKEKYHVRMEFYLEEW
jgi:hypothetical protein